MIKKFLLKLIPKRVKENIIYQYKSDIEGKRKSQCDLPRLDLEEKHIKNLKVLPNRLKLLDLLPKNAIVAEIGVDTGVFSEAIINYCKPEKIHLIDAWDTTRYNDDKKEAVFNKFNKEIVNKKLEIHVGYSTTVLGSFPNHYFDWVYIDTDHSYNTTKQELILAALKVKKEGYICGHDYIMGNWPTAYKYGVIEAVHEFCVLNNWELVYLTIEQSKPPSFALKKL